VTRQAPAMSTLDSTLATTAAIADGPTRAAVVHEQPTRLVSDGAHRRARRHLNSDQRIRPSGVGWRQDLDGIRRPLQPRLHERPRQFVRVEKLLQGAFRHGRSLRVANDPTPGWHSVVVYPHHLLLTSAYAIEFISPQKKTDPYSSQHRHALEEKYESRNLLDS
jgi:hypothetical protein